MIWLRFELVSTRLIFAKKFIAYYFRIVWPSGVLWPITFCSYLWIEIRLLGWKLDILTSFWYITRIIWTYIESVMSPSTLAKNMKFTVWITYIYTHAQSEWPLEWSESPIYKFISHPNHLYINASHPNHTYMNTYVYSNHPQPYIYIYIYEPNSPYISIYLMIRIGPCL